MLLRKDKTIIDLLNHIELKFGFDSFQVQDNWDADLCAVGITDASNSFLLYISSYDKPKDHFHLELEKNDGSQSIIKTTTNNLEEFDLFYSEHFI
jgi:hypothetical protein